jgi:hypothetical protein
MGIVLLVLGKEMNSRRVHAVLEALHAQHDLQHILVDADPIVSDWASPRFGRGCGPCQYWEGAWQMQHGHRPPLTSLDRVKALLEDATQFDPMPQVLVLGEAPGFDIKGQRVRAWDSSQAAVVQSARQAGLSGWALDEAGDLQPFEALP